MHEETSHAAPDWSGYAACTIVAKNYAALARVLCTTFLASHPGARAFVLLADENEGCIDPGAESFELFEARDIGIPEFEEFAFKYDVVEFSTALKPFFLQYLFAHREVTHLLYLDPDIQVFGPFEELRRALETHEVVLTPHILRPLFDDGRRPNETDFLLAGTFNLGFIALRSSRTADELLDWWQARLYDGAFSDPARGLFTDQKWINLVPGLFPNVGVLRHPGYNAAYWNLQERALAPAPGHGYLAEGEPLRFVHFSGFDPSHPNQVSKYQTRFRLPDLGRHWRDVFRGYTELLAAAGFAASRRWPYRYGHFDNDAPLPRSVRRAYWDFGPARRRFGNPFATAGADSFWAWLVGAHRPGSPIPNAGMILYALRQDVRTAFPDPDGAHAPALLDWLITHAQSDFGLGAAYVDAFRAARAALGAPPAPPPAASGPEPSRVQAVRAEGPPFGVNLFGYFDTESGVGEIARCLAAMLRAAEIPHALLNVEQPWLRRNDRTILSFDASWPYAVNLVAVNADQAPGVCAKYGLARGAGRYQVGYWFWELSRFPSRLVPVMDLFDEVWVASDFCQDAMARAGRLPVVRIRPGFEPRRARSRTREQFGLAGDEFVFLYVFDAASILKRKNPAGTISAFRRAFRPDEPVRLVLKTTNASERHLLALERLAGDARISIRNEYLDRAELLDFVDACDAYVSLHRSEGFGLTPLEALLFGKPVVATDYSGVREFLDAPGAYPVHFREVALRRDHGPYVKGSVWAEPDPGHAARQLRRVYDAARAGSAERVDASEVRRRFGVAATAAAMAERLALIRGFLGG